MEKEKKKTVERMAAKFTNVNKDTDKAFIAGCIFVMEKNHLEKPVLV